jgi:ribosomal protein S27E
MKILEDNSKNKYILPFTVTCSRCHSVLEVDKQDDVECYVPQQMQDDGSQQSYLFVKCPICQNHQKVHPKKAN